jgi:hypothetical protein
MKEKNDIVRNNTLSPARSANALDALGVFTATGTDTYAVTLGLGITALNANDEIKVVIPNANTGTTPTLAVTGASLIATYDIVGNDGAAIAAGDLKAGGQYNFRFDGTDLRVTNLGGGGGTTYTFGNGLTESGGTAKIGGLFTDEETYLRPSAVDKFLFIDGGLTTPWGAVFLGGNTLGIVTTNDDTKARYLQLGGYVGASNKKAYLYFNNYDGGPTALPTGVVLHGDDFSAINNVSEALLFRREVGNGSVSSGNGVGLKLNFAIKNNDTVGGYSTKAGLSYILTDVTNGSEDSKYVLSVLVNGVETTSFEITGLGIDMGSKKVYGLAAASANGEAVRYEQLVAVTPSGFSTLVDGASVTWNTASSAFPEAKLTSTQSFTIDMTNVATGSQGVLKLIKNTASDVILTFDTSFTNKQTNTTLTNYTFSGASGLEYFLSFVAEGTNLEWVIADPVTTTLPVPSWARVRRTTTQSYSNATLAAISWDTEDADNNSIWALSPNPTRFVIPGSGSKLVTISVFAAWAGNITGLRRLWIYKNGSSITGALADQMFTSPVGTETYMQRTFQVEATGGDYLEVMALQVSTTTLNLNSAQCSIKVESL